MNKYITVVSSKLASIQDLGRYGYEHIGMGNNGAVDTYAYLLGSVMVGNKIPKPSIEITAFDFSMTVNEDIIVCVTGAPANITIDSQSTQQWKTIRIQAGSILKISNITKGLRVYLSIEGGIDVSEVLGSSSEDKQAGIGSPIQKGQRISLKESDGVPIGVNHRLSPSLVPNYGSPWKIRVCDGPDVEIFRQQLNQFLNTIYTVSPASNHIGIRLDGEPLEDHNPKYTLSKGVGIGAIEIIPTGSPIVLHRGRGVTAGYPIIGVVASVDLGMIGQARPGDTVFFEHISIEMAVQLYRDKWQKIKNVSSALRLKSS